jgi:peroxiredoxin
MQFRKQLLLILTSFIMCSLDVASKNSYKIVGEVDSLTKRQPIYLCHFDEQRVSRIDTTYARRNRFTFEGEFEKDHLALITTGSFPNKVKSAKILLECGTIHVKLGCPSSVSRTTLNAKYQNYLDRDQSINTRYSAWIYYKPENDSLQLIRQDSIDSINNQHWDNETDVVLKNIRNDLGKYLFKRKYLTLGDRIFDLVYSSADSTVWNDTTYLKYIYWRELNGRKDKKVIDNQKKSMGMQFVNSRLINLVGDTVHLSDYVGKSKLLLLDFWASWCSPCIAEQKILKEQYKDLHSKGLEIIGISIDENRDVWQRSVKKNLLEWPQLLDIRSEDGGVRKIYNFVGIPHFVVLNESGKILNVGLFGDDLLRFLDQELLK